MKNLKKMSFMFWLVFFFTGQLLYAQTIGPYLPSSPCFSTSIVETVNNGTEARFEITIEFDASVLQPGQTINIQASNLSNGAQIYTEVCSMSPCIMEWRFPVAASPYKVHFECWTAPPATTVGGCALYEGCIIIIDG